MVILFVGNVPLEKADHPVLWYIVSGITTPEKSNPYHEISFFNHGFFVLNTKGVTSLIPHIKNTYSNPYLGEQQQLEQSSPSTKSSKFPISL